MVLSRRDFLILGTGLGAGSLGFSHSARAEGESDLLNSFPTLIAQNFPSSVFPGRHSGFLIQSNYGTFSNNFEAVFPSLAEGLTQVYRDNAQTQGLANK